MEVFQEYLMKIDSPEHRARVAEVLTWVGESFPELAPKIAWNQPMFTHHGTFIIGFSVSKNHMAVAPERAGMMRFGQEIEEAGYSQTKELFRIPWDKAVDWELLRRMIAFNILDKAECETFWRK